MYQPSNEDLMKKANDLRALASDIKMHAEAIHLMDAGLATQHWNSALELENDAKWLEAQAGGDIPNLISFTMTERVEP